jgi:hypothetical protein
MMRFQRLQRGPCSTKLSAFALLACLVLVPQVRLFAAPLPLMTACVDARNLVVDPAAPGVVTLKFVECFEQTLGVTGTLLANELEKDPIKRRIMAPFLSVFDSSVAKVLHALRVDTLPLASAEELIDSDTVIAQSGILEELVALDQFLEPVRQTDATASESTTAEIFETVIASGKKIAEAIVGTFKGVPAIKVKILIGILDVVIDEIFEILRTVL